MARTLAFSVFNAIGSMDLLSRRTEPAHHYPALRQHSPPPFDALFLSKVLGG